MAGGKDWRRREYYLHDTEFMELLPPPATDIERKATLLHSTLATDAATPEDLLACGVETQVVRILMLVITGPCVASRAACLQKCREIVASKNSAAIKVKLAEMLANTAHPGNDYTETIELMTATLQSYDVASRI